MTSVINVDDRIFLNILNVKIDKFTGLIINSVNFLLHYFQFLGFILKRSNSSL